MGDGDDVDDDDVAHDVDGRVLDGGNDGVDVACVEDDDDDDGGVYNSAT